VVLTSKHRTKADGAECGREVIDEHHPDASVMVLVMDNLNIYRLSSLYEAFEPAEATVDWQFATDDARIKLKRLYPRIDDGHGTRC
jgi:hypothetical protein